MLTEKELRDILYIGIDITTEKNKRRLMEKMLDKAMEVTECDAGSLYIYQEKEKTLHFILMKTISQNRNICGEDDTNAFPPVPLSEENVCAYAALRRQLINIADVYCDSRFDFSGPKNYDRLTQYRTGSMLVTPLENAEGVLIGVLQLINKHGAEKFEQFTEDDEFIITSLGSMASIAISEMIYIEEIKEQMFSFARAFAAAVDERTPYNGTHTRKVTEYARILAEYINKMHDAGECEDHFDENRKEQLVLAATLHDIGKLIVPLEIMNKPTRLDTKLERVENRFEKLKLVYERDALKGRISAEEEASRQTYLDEAIADIRRINNADFISDEDIVRIREIGSHIFIQTGSDSTVFERPYLTEDEMEDLSIRRGTLTRAERQSMEDHVVMTRRILEKVHYNDRYANVTDFAASHHEFLDGSGYPDHLAGASLALEARILSVVDIFDALTCAFRPYKKETMSREKAFAVLRTYVSEGKMEGRLVDYLEKALAEIPQEEIDKRCAEW